MQLIFETQPTDDLKNMSTQSNSQIMNGEISDINTGNPLSSKENKLTYDGETVNLKEINVLASEVKKDINLEKESFQENNTNGSNNGVGEITKDDQECELLENIKSIIDESSTSGANNKQEENISVAKCTHSDVKKCITLTVDPAEASEKDCLQIDREINLQKCSPDAEINLDTVSEQASRSSFRKIDKLQAVNPTNTVNTIEDLETMNEDRSNDCISHNDASAICNFLKENIKVMGKQNVECLEACEGQTLSADDVENVSDNKSEESNNLFGESTDDADNLESKVSIDRQSFEHPTNKDQPDVNEKEESINSNRIYTNKTLTSMNVCVDDSTSIHEENADGNTDKYSLIYETSPTNNLDLMDGETGKQINVLENVANTKKLSSVCEMTSLGNIDAKDDKPSHLPEDDGNNDNDGNSSESSVNELRLIYETTPTSDVNSIDGEKDEISCLPEFHENYSKLKRKEVSSPHDTTQASVNVDFIEKPFDISEDNLNLTELNTDELSLVRKTSPKNNIKDPKSSINAEIEKSISDDKMSLSDQENTLSNDISVENALLETSDGKHSENILMDAEVITAPKIVADVLVNDELLTNDIEMPEIGSTSEDKILANKEIIPTIDIIMEDKEKRSTAESTILLESCDISIEKPINNVLNTGDDEVVIDKALENSNNEELVEKTNACAEKELVNCVTGEKNVPMEVDDSEIVDLGNDNQEENTLITEKSPNPVDDKEKLDGCIDVSGDPMNESITKITPVTEVFETTGKEQDSIENTTCELPVQELTEPQNKPDKVEVVDEDDLKIVENKAEKTPSAKDIMVKSAEHKETKTLPIVCKLSNTLNILSDDEEEPPMKDSSKSDNSPKEKQCINIDDDDDIMFIEEDSNSKESLNGIKTDPVKDADVIPSKPQNNSDIQTGEKDTKATDMDVMSPKINEKDVSPTNNTLMELETSAETEKNTSQETELLNQKKPLLPQTFLKTAKKNLAEMTRDELEDFCILRIVESIVDRSNLGDIKTKMKTLAQNLEDYRKRALMLTKQNRDLQVVLKSVQEEQKKRSHSLIQPLKITRSVGMQVLMNDKIDARRKGLIPCQTTTAPAGRPARALQTTKTTKPLTALAIPVPRKVPVSPAKAITNTPNNIAKTASPSPNGIRNPSPVQKAPEKRTHSRMQSTSSVTVDLTDDEPPPKINNKNTPPPPVRVVPPQNLMPQQRFAQPLNSPRKVYIPISGPQAQNIRPGQTLVMRNVVPNVPRQRVPPMPRMQPSPIRNKAAPQVSNRHPAPLPDLPKQYSSSTWKPMPQPPDLKLSKVENGIVISWKIDGYPDVRYETIASYQLFAYQETSAPPSTGLWKKIGDVKALPLPMACTLTQFMAGFKYYFAVRAVDVRSRIGPFSLPGSILLLNKV